MAVIYTGRSMGKREEYGLMAVKYSRFYGGKIETVPKVPVTKLRDFAIWYTPGVAEVSRVISRDPDLSFEYTGRWNTIAIITDGTRVLGLGNVGPEASMPVMEGKGLLFKYLGGVDAVPIPIRERDPDLIITIVKRLEPAFGGINLEDIESPKCFYLLDRLREEMNIPVWHDDQLGTAGAALAALYNALKIVGKKLTEVRIAMVGAGAANIATARLLIAAGADPGRIYLVDRRGILRADREDMDELMLRNKAKYDLALKTNREKRSGGIPEAMEGADVVIAASRPGPGVIRKEWVGRMADDPIVFALANPVPEIWPWEAKEAGARIVATGRSDFPNQVNNSLVFPAVFRGVLDVRARTINDEMTIEAAKELARFAEEKGINEDYIIPTMEEWEVYPRVAAAVAVKAVEMRVARREVTWDEEVERARAIIWRVRRTISLLLENGLIKRMEDIT